MGMIGRATNVWKNMIGDMSGRYQELRHKEKRQPLNKLERGELRSLNERTDPEKRV